MTVVSSTGHTRAFKIVGLFHTGATARDEGEAYVLLKNAQILTERAERHQRDPPAPRRSRRGAGGRARVEAQLGYKAVSWQEANESLLEALVIRNVIMYTVVAAILLVAGFGIFNIISTITHEKARDIAILKSLGFPQGDMRRLFLLEGLAIGIAGSLLGWLVGFGLAFALSQVQLRTARRRPRDDPPAARLELLALSDRRWLRAAVGRASRATCRRGARRGSIRSTSSGAPRERADRGGRLTRMLPATVPVTLVQRRVPDDRRARVRRHHRASGSGKSSLLYLLGLLDRPTSGALSIAGRGHRGDE